MIRRKRRIKGKGKRGERKEKNMRSSGRVKMSREGKINE